MILQWVLLMLLQLTIQDAGKNWNYFPENDEFLKVLRKQPFGVHEYVEYQTAEVALPDKGLAQDIINVTLNLWSSSVQLHLQRNPLSRHNNFQFLIRNGNFSQSVGNGVFDSADCFYGYHEFNIKASVDLCDGLNGVLWVNNVLYVIKSLPRKYQRSKAISSHLILKMNSLGEMKNEKTDGSRRKRSFHSKEVKVETAVFVDRDLYAHILNNFPNNTERNLFRFVLAMINAVQLLYHDDSLEYKVSFVLKRLEILHSDPPQLQRSHDIDRYLSNFCTWQEKENTFWEKNPLHWDHALMLTGLDLYAITKNGKLSNQVLGLAPVAGMCKPSSSCTVNEGLHFESVYVVAHEIGHNLGMRHDGPSADNDCDSTSYLMSPTLGSGKSTWSSCSNNYLKQFLLSPQAKCLFETTHIELDHSEGGTLPGERFDSNLQCVLKYGKQSERSPIQNIEEICRDLRCTKERFTWTSHPALEGTKCGHNKWCRSGRCIERGQPVAHIVDGGWSEWSPYSDCASACLLGNDNSQVGSSGIAISSRTCNNPRPGDGGRTCFGNDKKYRTCRAKQCVNVPSITVTEFAEQICRRAREVDKDLTGFGFQKNNSDAEEACTVWCHRYKGGAKSRGWVFPDGTTCHFNHATSNPTFCISGKCEEFHCEPTGETMHIASHENCQSGITQTKVSETGWTSVGACRYNCITPASGLRVMKRGNEHSIQLCQSSNCIKKKTLFEYATHLCTKYRKRVKKLSGLGIQLSASFEDPDRPCHVACQDDKIYHRFYLVTGEDGWFPFGADCSRGISNKKAYCISGKCLEFGRNNLPKEQSELKFSYKRRKRSLKILNKTVTASIDLAAIKKVINLLNNGNAAYIEPIKLSIDFDNPIHVKPDWEAQTLTTATHSSVT